jgi:hypothetical protein
MQKKVFYRDFVSGKKHCTTGKITVNEESWHGRPPVKVVYVSRPGSETVLPEWLLAPESRHLIQQGEVLTNAQHTRMV